MFQQFAYFAMVLDHLGLIFDIPQFRFIGRFTFPIFLVSVCYGVRFSSDVSKYLFRLFLLASLTIVPHGIFLFLTTDQYYFNSVFTLFVLASILVLVTRILAKEVPPLGIPLLLSFLIFVCFLYLNSVIPFEYGLFGVTSGILIYAALDCFNFPKIPNFHWKWRYKYLIYPLHFVPLILIGMVYGLSRLAP